MKNSPKAIAVQQRQRNDFVRVSDGDSEGIIPPTCALCMNWSNAERKSERDVLMTDCPRGLPAVSSVTLTLGLLQVSPSPGELNHAGDGCAKVDRLWLVAPESISFLRRSRFAALLELMCMEGEMHG